MWCDCRPSCGVVSFVAGMDLSVHGPLGQPWLCVCVDCPCVLDSPMPCTSEAGTQAHTDRGGAARHGAHLRAGSSGRRRRALRPHPREPVAALCYSPLVCPTVWSLLVLARCRYSSTRCAARLRVRVPSLTRSPSRRSASHDPNDVRLLMVHRVGARVCVGSADLFHRGGDPGSEPRAAEKPGETVQELVTQAEHRRGVPRNGAAIATSASGHSPWADSISARTIRVHT